MEYEVYEVTTVQVCEVQVSEVQQPAKREEVQVGLVPQPANGYRFSIEILCPFCLRSGYMIDSCRNVESYCSNCDKKVGECIV